MGRVWLKKKEFQISAQLKRAALESKKEKWRKLRLSHNFTHNPWFILETVVGSFLYKFRLLSLQSLNDLIYYYDPCKIAFSLAVDILAC